jgi:hypothetical protein
VLRSYEASPTRSRGTVIREGTAVSSFVPPARVKKEAPTSVKKEVPPARVKKEPPVKTEVKDELP